MVMIAAAASSPPSGFSAAVAFPMPASIFSIGSACPITPVEHTKMERADTPSASAVCSAIATASW